MHLTQVQVPLSQLVIRTQSSAERLMLVEIEAPVQHLADEAIEFGVVSGIYPRFQPSWFNLEGSVFVITDATPHAPGTASARWTHSANRSRSRNSNCETALADRRNRVANWAPDRPSAYFNRTTLR